MCLFLHALVEKSGRGERSTHRPKNSGRQAGLLGDKDGLEGSRAVDCCPVLVTPAILC
jgi:hypothetical protein